MDEVAHYHILSDTFSQNRKYHLSDRGTGAYVAQQELYTTYEENFDVEMNPTRREFSLKAKLNFWKSVCSDQAT